MSDTIELLEAIGRNASLRHASADELAHVLGQAGASEAIQAAAMHGDAAPLSAEFGQLRMHTTHHSQAPAHEDDQPGQNDKDDDAPSQKPAHAE